MRRKQGACALAMVCFVGVATLGLAQPSKEARYEHADRNDDGRVDKKEMRIEKDWERQQEHAQTQLSKVNTKVEQKYDSNADGRLDAQEARQLMQDKYALIITDGKAKVDTSLEEKYDLDKDGIISQQEAEAIKQDWRFK